MLSELLVGLVVIAPNGGFLEGAVPQPHSPVNRAVHAGRCRRHDRLGHRGRTDRSPAASASARITEMTSGCRRGASSRRLPLAARLGIETMHSGWLPSVVFCRRGCDEGVNALKI